MLLILFQPKRLKFDMTSYRIFFFSGNRKFLYFDDDRIKGAYKDWNPPTNKMLLYFKNFSELMEELDKADNGSRAYFQVSDQEK